MKYFTIKLIPALILGIGLNLIVLVLMSHVDSDTGLVHATAFTVCPGSTCDFNTIQAAVNAAGDHDVIKVAAGTYTHLASFPRRDIMDTGVVTQVLYISKSVTIRGGYTTTFAEPPDPIANLTKIEIQGQGRAIYITGNITPTLEGITISGGISTGLGGDNSFGPPDTDAGGGVYVITATVIISNCVIIENKSAVGGGIYLKNSSALIIGNRVVSNTASRSGGGIYTASSIPTIHSNAITANSSSDTGGGVSLVASQGAFFGNTIISNTAGYGGGGLMLAGSQTLVERNLISNNIAGGPGGGLVLNLSDAPLYGNSIARNISGSDDNFSGSGGGLFVINSDPVLVNNLVVDNQIIGDSAFDQGSALYIRASSPKLWHTTIARNLGHGSGVFVASDSVPHTVSLTNTILVSHTVGVSVTAAQTVKLTHTLWGSGQWTNGTDTKGPGLIIQSNDYFGNPNFEAFAIGNYHIMTGSAAIDRGIAGITIDIDQETRDALPDLGADEYVVKTPKVLHLPIILK